MIAGENISDTQSPKMKAYLKMQELRKETVKYDISNSERTKALDDSFGVLIPQRKTRNEAKNKMMD